MMLNTSILREYDIRGIYPSTLNEQAARRIGAAFATTAAAEGDGPLCVGYDGRQSSPALTAALIEGIRSTGCNVLDIGVGPTPMLYYAVCTTQGARGGIMVTGSHNPPDHNGFKFMLGKKPFFGEQIKALAQVTPSAATSPGLLQHVDISAHYLTELRAAWPEGARPLHVAWDAGNGATGDIMVQLAARLPGTHILLNETIDGTFPVHHPDPAVAENLEQLMHTVRDNRCDLGIAFDGDGDRIGVVDDAGEIVWGDELLALYAADVLQTTPGSTIIADVKASQGLFSEITRLGGHALMWKTGHSHIKAKMLEIGAPLAGEMSGHMFFADRYFGFDDALYAAIRLLGLLARSSVPLSELRRRLPRYVSTPEMRFVCEDDKKFAFIDAVKTRLQTAGATVIAVDGVRVQTPDGWWLLRASNTQPMLSARCEAKDAAGLKRLQAALGQALEAEGMACPSFA